MDRTIAYGIRFSAGWWSGKFVDANRAEMHFSHDILDATLMRDSAVAEGMAERLGGTVRRVELLVE